MSSKYKGFISFSVLMLHISIKSWYFKYERELDGLIFKSISLSRNKYKIQWKELHGKENVHNFGRQGVR